MSGDWRAEVPRDGAAYYLSDHAFIRSKERDIDHDLITAAIEEGHLQEAKGGFPAVRFLYDPALVDPIGVVADAESGEIETVYWNYKYDHHDQLEAASPTSTGGHRP